MHFALVSDNGVAVRTLMIGIFHVIDAAWNTAQTPWDEKEESSDEAD